ncbi:hypothetical protein BB560_003599 [Smittium megazygosporum]|uniref:Structure-specific endonuclease subunit SLX1 C-terminal domain-containing protein n=1 Tax=Smittium megazygosporum TaxID=133381 RepID=A0A2T9ZBK1_9FUNG|nr:hypothetical protein BB560_003599 [Smittium megazygosporum]
MIIIVFGFPSKYAALQFEWAWQNPQLSRHFEKVSPNPSLSATLFGKNQRTLKSKLIALVYLLSLPYFERWPLSICFSTEKFKTLFIDCFNQICNNSNSSDQDRFFEEDIFKESLFVKPLPDETVYLALEKDQLCSVCSSVVTEEQPWTACANSECKIASHLVCIAKESVKGTGFLIPKYYTCSQCNTTIKWGHVVKSFMESNTSD